MPVHLRQQGNQFESHENTFLKVFQRHSLCPDVLTPTGRHTHWAAHAGPGSPLSSTLEKQNSSPWSFASSPLPAQGSAGASGGRAGRKPPRPAPTPGGTRARPTGRRHLLRGPRAGAAPQPGPGRARRSPLSAPRPDSAASGETTASRPGRPPSPPAPL